MSLWLLGGIDPTGGAGLWRDTWAAHEFAPELELRPVVTAWTWQRSGQPTRCRAPDLGYLQAACEGLTRAAAVKLGLLPTEVARWLAGVERGDAWWVVDPVLAPTSGGAFGVRNEDIVALRGANVLFTPNRCEAAALAGHGDSSSLDWLPGLVRRLTPAPVLIKSARVEPDRVADLLVWHGREHWFERARADGPDPRGTGCALATAIAAGLAQRRDVPTAIDAAVTWLGDRRRHPRRLANGQYVLA